MEKSENRWQELIFYYGCFIWAFFLIFSTFIAEALAIGLIIFWWVWVRKKFAFRTRLDGWLGLFLVLRLASIGFSIDPWVSATAVRKIPFLLVFFPLSRFAGRYSQPAVVRLLWVVIIAATLSAAVALLSLARFGIHRVHSTTSGPETLATFLAAAFTLELGLLIFAGKTPGPKHVLSLGLLLCAMAFTYNRAPWAIALIAGMGVVTKMRRMFPVLLVAAGLSFALVPNYGYRFRSVIHWPPDLGEREVIWESAWRHARQRPLTGFGPNTFHLVFDRREELRDRGVGAWHNSLLQIWLESGLITLLAFVGLLVYMGRIALRHIRSHAGKPHAAILSSLLGAIAVILAISM
ncbi:MAG: O-antigen ligase family protein, partial [Calditrichaeota bacterium]